MLDAGFCVVLSARHRKSNCDAGCLPCCNQESRSLAIPRPWERQIKYVKGIDLSPREVEEAQRRYEEGLARRRGADTLGHADTLSRTYLSAGALTNFGRGTMPPCLKHGALLS